MNILLIHSDKLEYEIKQKTKLAEKIPKELEHKKLKDCLVCFMAFEVDDDSAPEAVTKNLVKEISAVAQQVKEKNLVLYPYVHLLFGKSPSKPETALKIMKKAEQLLKEKKFNVTRVPFGYYKGFELKCKGHPLSELSREVKAIGREEAELSTALKKEQELKSSWFILDLKGKLHKIAAKKGRIEGFDFKKYPELERLALYEISKSRAVTEEPPHVKLMKQLELADYEPASDPGNIRYPPKGKMVKALIEEFVTQKMQEYGAMEIESPVMFDFVHPALESYLDRFPARQYSIVTPNKKVFLRFAACFGQFLMLHDAQLSYKHLPIKMYELAKHSFRVEKRGELTGLRRLRAFTMPDTHAFCADLNQAKEQFMERFKLSKSVQDGLGLKTPESLELAVRAVKPFYEKNKDFVLKLVKEWGKPCLLEVWDEQFFYFTLKYEFNFVDALGKASALTTDQIDVENAKRYDIKFVGKDGKGQHPLILHCSPSGAIERVMYALLEKAFLEEKKAKKPPVLPLWLSPTQARLCVVSDEFLDFALKVAQELEKKNIRVDIDDRNETIGKKIREAELAWVPLIIVVGAKEKKSRKFPVRFKATGKIKPMSLAQIVKEVAAQTQDKPFRPLPEPKLLSLRPTFISKS